MMCIDYGDAYHIGGHPHTHLECAWLLISKTCTHHKMVQKLVEVQVWPINFFKKI